MTAFFYSYISAWMTACLVAVILMVRNRGDIILLQKRYWKFLLIKWKLATFIIALAAFVFLAPYTGDPTWDFYDAAFMSVLTFMSAPWAIGILFRYINGREKTTIAYIAVCAWMFSASWSYDIYLVLRDGYYPVTWWTNILASSVLYFSAGLFWNLEYRKGRGVIFGFMAEDWPAGDADSSFNRVLLYALPFMILAGAVFIPFFI